MKNDANINDVGTNRSKLHKTSNLYVNKVKNIDPQSGGKRAGQCTDGINRVNAVWYRKGDGPLRTKLIQEQSHAKSLASAD